MPKFSIVIPVYNVEKYIKICLDSIFNQSYKDFEVIVVNDGSNDNSLNIIKKYDVKLINQENSGVSQARNNGIKKAKGDYLIFVDSDDFIEKDLLKNISKSLNNNPDIVRYQAKNIIDDKIIEYKEKEFIGKTGADAFKEFINFHYVDPVWLYAIKRDFYIKNKFEFQKDTVHEDFGLIPSIICKGKVVNSINYIGYNYVYRNGSIMTNKDYNNTLRKVDDMYSHYKRLVNEEQDNIENKKYFDSFYANCLILKTTELKKKDYKKYKKILKDDKVFDKLLDDTFFRKIKKAFIKKSPKIYYKFTKRD